MFCHTKPEFWGLFCNSHGHGGSVRLTLAGLFSLFAKLLAKHPRRQKNELSLTKVCKCIAVSVQPTINISTLQLLAKHPITVSEFARSPAPAYFVSSRYMLILVHALTAFPWILKQSCHKDWNASWLCIFNDLIAWKASGESTPFITKTKEYYSLLKLLAIF